MSACKNCGQFPCDGYDFICINCHETISSRGKEKTYRCTECGWRGPHSDLMADYIPGDGDLDELWSNEVCPRCGTWDCHEEEIEER